MIKTLLLLRTVFGVTRIRRNWLDIFVEQVNREKNKLHWLDESAYSRTNEPWKKDQTVSFQSTNKESAFRLTILPTANILILSSFVAGFFVESEAAF